MAMDPCAICKKTHAGPCPELPVLAGGESAPSPATPRTVVVVAIMPDGTFHLQIGAGAPNGPPPQLSDIQSAARILACEADFRYEEWRRAASRPMVEVPTMLPFSRKH